MVQLFQDLTTELSKFGTNKYHKHYSQVSLLPNHLDLWQAKHVLLFTRKGTRMKCSSFRTQVFACLFTFACTTQIKSACAPLHKKTADNAMQTHDTTTNQHDFVHFSDEISFQRSNLVILTPLLLTLGVIQAFARTTRQLLGMPIED
jgi:hypothetical protein